MTTNKKPRITKKYIRETLDGFTYPQVQGASFLDGLMTQGQLRYTMYAKSAQAARAGASMLASKLIESEFPARVLIHPHLVQTGASKGQWKVEALLDLYSQHNITVRLNP